MKTCASCGHSKPNHILACPSCNAHDPEVLRLMVGGTPDLTLLIVAIVIFWVYRFWRIGWVAWSGNLRLVAIIALGLGASALIWGAMWTFGIRSRKQGAIVFAVALIAYALLQFA